jgi:hypothetical protein
LQDLWAGSAGSLTYEKRQLIVLTQEWFARDPPAHSKD